MNLHGIVSNVIGAVNPHITAQVRVSTGYTTTDSGRQEPSYAPPVTVQIQRQELSFKDLQHVERVNMQGVFVSAYMDGRFYGVYRPNETGGDLFEFDGATWLVVAVPEIWPDWCKVLLCQQS